MLKVRPVASVEGVGGISDILLDRNGKPEQAIMQHLLELFDVHLGSLVPYLNKSELERRLQEQASPIFLLNSIAAAAAR